MKKITMIISIAFSVIQVYAQTNALISREFWQAKPDLNAVKAQLDKGFSYKDVKGMNDPIALAITTDAPFEITRYLIDQPGVDLKHLTVEGRIYLHLAANKGNAEVTDYLIRKGSDIYFLDANGHTAFTFAAVQGNLNPALIDAFSKGGVDLQKKYESKQGANILLLAVAYDKELINTNYLVSKGVSIHSTDNEGNTAFNYAATVGNVELMKKLIAKGVTYTDNALIMAARGTYRTANTMDVFKYLVEELKIKPIVTDKNGQNVLHPITKKQNQLEIVNYFINKGVDINQVDKEGNTPFINAAGGRSFEVVELLFSKLNKKKINLVNTQGKSALMAAVQSGAGKTVELLVNNGADVKIKDKEGNTLAYYLIDSYQIPGGRGAGGFGGGTAAQGGPTGGNPMNGNSGTRGAGSSAGPRNAVNPIENFTVKINALRKGGLDFKTLQKDGNTIYHLAAAKADLALLKSIEDLGVDVNIRNREGNTALHKAAMFSKDDTILKYLLSIGANKDSKTDFDETAYSLAKENEFLIKNNVSIEFLK